MSILLYVLRRIPYPFCYWQEVREGENIIIHILLFSIHVATLRGPR